MDQPQEQSQWSVYKREGNSTVVDEWYEPLNEMKMQNLRFSVPPGVWKCLCSKANKFDQYSMQKELQEQLASEDKTAFTLNVALICKMGVVQMYHKRSFLMYRTQAGKAARFICLYSGICSQSEGPLYFFLARTQTSTTGQLVYPWCLSAVLSKQDIQTMQEMPQLRERKSWNKHLSFTHFPSGDQLEQLQLHSMQKKIELEQWHTENKVVHKENLHIYERRNRLESKTFQGNKLKIEKETSKHPVLFKDKNDSSLRLQYLEPIHNTEGELDGYYALEKIKEGVYERKTILSKKQAKYNLDLTQLLSAVERTHIE